VPPQARLVTTLPELEPYLGQWDELAIASGRPYCCPAWMLAWWRHAGAEDELRVVLLVEGDELVALAPFCLSRWRGMNVYRLLCAGTSTRIGPLPAAGVADDHARAVATALAAAPAPPDVFRFEGIDAKSPWPKLLAQHWPGRRPHLRTDFELDAPTVDISEGYDAWFSSRSRNFRKDLNRVRRRLAERGAEVRMSDADHLEADLRDLFRLHHARWDERGGSGNLDPAIEGMIRDCADALFPLGRFRLFVLEAEGKAISAGLLIDAGKEAAVWGGGFDPEWSKFGPGMTTQAAAIEDSAKRGQTCVDFGEGEEHYKRVIGVPDQPVAWMTLFPKRARYPVSYLTFVPYDVRNRLRDRVKRTSPETRERLRKLRRVVGR
jgi:CelD/BcsL family acetyltransferase involved in cellulose biosynthesis